jgi:hypothetical protein
VRNSSRLTGASTALFGTSLILRKKNSRTTGRGIATVGYGVMMAAAHLGGKMVYESRVGVDRTAGQAFPKKFVAIMPETERRARAEYRCLFANLG